MATAKSIKESLEKQLVLKGANTEFFKDLIQDYVSFWSIKNKLKADIKKRGINYQDVSSAGKMMWKSNPSVKELVGVNRQMLCILNELNLTTEETGSGEADDL